MINLSDDLEDYFKSLNKDRDKLRWKVWRFFHNIPRNVRWAFYTPRHWYQRARYGVSSRDIWNFDGYIARVMTKGLQTLATTKHGVSMDYIDDPNTTSSEDINAAWDKQRDDYLREAAWWADYSEGKFDFVAGAEHQAGINQHLDWLKNHLGGLWD